jgi:nitrate/TMAO reductase-like tetraheme cytochrome c subunit
MNTLVLLLITACLVTVGVVLLARSEPAHTRTRTGKVFALVALVIAPFSLTALGTREHLQRAQSTQFCLSCHLMGPYGQSLSADTDTLLAAVHYQNRYIPQDNACYTCHTTYTMFGGFKAKLTGAQHLLVNVLGTAKQPLELYEPYANRECLRCHSGARRFETSELHVDMAAELASGQVSCLECHGPAHNVDEVSSFGTWEASTP